MSHPHGHTMTADKKFWAYWIEPDTGPLPCVLCGEPPRPDEPVLETLRGEPKLICSRCIDTANAGFYDLNIRTYGAL